MVTSHGDALRASSRDEALRAAAWEAKFMVDRDRISKNLLVVLAFLESPALPSVYRIKQFQSLRGIETASSETP